jgi:hypothetical protein
MVDLVSFLVSAHENLQNQNIKISRIHCLAKGSTSSVVRQELAHCNACTHEDNVICNYIPMGMPLNLQVLHLTGCSDLRSSERSEFRSNHGEMSSCFVAAKARFSSKKWWAKPTIFHAV